MIEKKEKDAKKYFKFFGMKFDSDSEILNFKYLKETLIGFEQHKLISMSLILFLVLSFVTIPLFFKFISLFFEPYYSYNMFSLQPFVIFIIILLAILNREEFFNYVYGQKKSTTVILSITSLIYFILFFVTNFKLGLFDIAVQFNIGVSFILSRIFYVLGLVNLAFLIFGVKFFKISKREWTFFTILGSGYFLITLFLWVVWDKLAFIISKLIYYLISLLPGNAFLETGGVDPILGYNSFSAAIGAPCSGIDSLGIFIGLFILLLVYEHHRLNKLKALLVFSFGLILVFLLNFIRVSSIIVVGSKFPSFAEGTLHSNLGWVFFVIIIYVLLQYTYNWSLESN